MKKKNKISVHTVSDVNITEQIEIEIEKVVKSTIDTLAKKYYRTISADINVNVE